MQLKIFYTEDLLYSFEFKKNKKLLKDYFQCDILSDKVLTAKSVKNNFVIILVTKESFLEIKDKVNQFKVDQDQVSYVCLHDYKDKRNDGLNIEFSYSNFLFDGNYQFLINFLQSQISLLRSKRNYKNKILSLQDKEKSFADILEVGLKLSQEKDIEKLLTIILKECINLTNSDAGSLALLGRDKRLKKIDDNQLTFFASKNISMKLNFTRFTMPVTNKSISGFSILSKKSLNIDDAYNIDSKQPYSFAKQYDQETGFRTKSMVVVPMMNSIQEVFGVVILINKKAKNVKKINYKSFKPEFITSFDETDLTKITALTSLATVALENNLLYDGIQNLLEGFVEASVSTIESRDPSTSGHSFRVATNTVALAKEINRDKKGAYREISFTPDQLKEIEYASLLHDFGKVSVKERVLLKADKLEVTDLKLINSRLEYYSVYLMLEAEKKKVKLFKKCNSEQERQDKTMEIEILLNNQLEKLELYKKTIEELNSPSFFVKEKLELLEEMKHISFKNHSNQKVKLLNDWEYENLSVEKGSLNIQERKEIESHVSHTFNFLCKIPWTKNLEFIPKIAYKHHEKLNGSGYPLSAKANDIPVQSRMMTICDIYDALVATDRPYKRSMPERKALSIIEYEVDEGRLDKDLFSLFIDKKVYKNSQKWMAQKRVNI